MNGVNLTVEWYPSGFIEQPEDDKRYVGYENYYNWDTGVADMPIYFLTCHEEDSVSACLSNDAGIDKHFENLPLRFEASPCWRSPKLDMAFTRCPLTRGEDR